MAGWRRQVPSRRRIRVGETSPRAFRVELRRPGGPPAALGRAEGVAAHHASLTPFLGRLRLDGHAAGGELVLLDEATGAVVARRRLDAPRR